jgi:hypothetical protein
MQSRLRFVQKRPVPRRVGKRVVSSANIKKDAVTPVELAPDSVTPEALAPDSVTQDAIAPGAVSDTELALGAGGADTTFSGSQPVNPAVGDVWFDSSDSLKLKRYDGTNWVSMRDLGIAAAQAGADAASTAAAAAQTTADGKNKVYRQTAEPTGGTYAEGDLWFDTDDNNKIYRRTSSAWTAVQLGGEALANINANKITAGTIDASVITVSNLNAGNLTAGTIAAARITSTSISAADINADRLTAGTIASARITSTSISAADINADRITAGTLTGRAINNGSGTFSVDTAGNLTATSASITGTINSSGGTIAGWNISGGGFTTGGTYASGGVTYPIAALLSNGSFVAYQFNDAKPGSFVVDVDNGVLLNAVSLRSTSTGGSKSAWYPYYDNNANLGTSGFRWKNVFAVNTAISASDARLKTEIKTTDLGLNFIEKLRPVSYKWVSEGNRPVLDEDGKEVRDPITNITPVESIGPGLRTLYGLIAQEVRQAVADLGIDPSDFGPWTLSNVDDPDSSQGLKYDQFIPMLIKAVQELSAKVKELESNQ